MPARRSSPLVPLAFGASLAIHATLMVLVNRAIIARQDQLAHARTITHEVLLAPPDDPPPPEPAKPDPPEPPREPEPEPEPQPEPEPPADPPPPIPTVVHEVPLGIDTPNPPSQVWVGFKEFLEQFAPPGEVDQAAFTDQPVLSAPPTAAETPPTPTASEAPAEPVEPSPAVPAKPQAAKAEPPPLINPVDPTEPATSTNPPADPPAVVPSPPTDAPEPSIAPDPTPSIPTPAVDPAQAAADTKRLLSDVGLPLIEPAEPAAETLRESDAAEPAASTTANPTEPPQTTINPSSSAASQPATAGAAPAAAAAALSPPAPPSDLPAGSTTTTGTPHVGAQADKESDASSIITVPRENWRLGKPVAGRGLELKPRRPELTELMRLTASPGNPLCRLLIGSDGVPLDAAILESSGDTRIDEAIRSSLYRWRASGEELAKLPPGHTIQITLRLILNGRR